MSEQNKQVVLKFVQAMGNADAETAAACLTPDAVLVSKGFSKLAGSHSFKDLIGVIGGLKQALPTGMRLTVHTVTAEGDRVVVESEGNAITSQGKPYCNQYCEVYTLSDGRIRQINEYFCTKLFDEVFYPVVVGLLEQTPGK